MVNRIEIHRDETGDYYADLLSFISTDEEQLYFSGRLAESKHEKTWWRRSLLFGGQPCSIATRSLEYAIAEVMRSVDNPRPDNPSPVFLRADTPIDLIEESSGIRVKVN